MQPLKAVLFDLDGTLINSIDHIIACGTAKRSRAKRIKSKSQTLAGRTCVS